jgi:hypothetical protein
MAKVIIFQWHIEGGNGLVSLVTGNEDTVVIDKTEFRHTYKWLAKLFINPDLITLLSEKLSFTLGENRALDIWGTFVIDSQKWWLKDNEYMTVSDLLWSWVIGNGVSVDLRMPTLPENQQLSVIGDFLKPEVQQCALQKLGDNPNIVIWSQVFINDLPGYMNCEFEDVSQFHFPTLANNLAEEARGLLKKDWIMIVNNRTIEGTWDHFIPPFVKGLSEHLRYFVMDWLTRVYQK